MQAALVIATLYPTPPVLAEAYPRLVAAARRLSQPGLQADAVHEAIVDVLARGAVSLEDPRSVGHLMRRAQAQAARQWRAVRRTRRFEHEVGVWLDRVGGDVWAAADYVEEFSAAARTGRRNAAKSHCPAGHLYDADNTYRRPNGSRVCRACARAVVRVRPRRQVTPRAPSETCRHGHLRREHGFQTARGGMGCRACARAAKARWLARRRASR